MIILLIILIIICLTAILLYLRLRWDICFLYNQLGEIADGSHMELTVNSRQKALLALCGRLNQVLASKDQSHIRYLRSQRQLKQNITHLAHDIRTPLTGASGYVQLAQECEDSEKRTRYLEAAGRRMAELEDMLEKLFLYTKLTNDTFRFSEEAMKKVSVLPLLNDCLLGMYTKFEEKGAAPEVSFETERFTITADEDALKRIFLNLIQNALLHGSGGISITQHTEDDGSSRLVFENPVPEDNNISIHQIFDQFYKAGPARGKGSSGLGLFIVKELMARMEGRVWAELDGGCLRIVLCFPAESSKTFMDPES